MDGVAPPRIERMESVVDEWNELNDEFQQLQVCRAYVLTIAALHMHYVGITHSNSFAATCH